MLCKTNKKISTIMLVIIFVVFFGKISYAKYIKTEEVKVTQKIALPILNISEGKYVKLDNKNRVGYYEFEIKNFNENSISEIGFFYTIEIVSNIKEEIQFELYNNEKIIKLVNLKTEKILIKGNEKNEHKYKLKIVYNGEEKEVSEKIQIKIHSEQEII